MRLGHVRHYHFNGLTKVNLIAGDGVGQFIVARGLHAAFRVHTHTHFFSAPVVNIGVLAKAVAYCLPEHVAHVIGPLGCFQKEQHPWRHIFKHLLLLAIPRGNRAKEFVVAGEDRFTLFPICVRKINPPTAALNGCPEGLNSSPCDDQLRTIAHVLHVEDLPLVAGRGFRGFPIVEHERPTIAGHIHFGKIVAAIAAQELPQPLVGFARVPDRALVYGKALEWGHA